MPADSATPLLGLLLQGTGNNSATWGDKFNNEVISPIEQSIAGMHQRVLTGGSVSLSEDDRKRAIFKFIGSLSSNCVITLPANLSKFWVVDLGTTLNGFTVSIKTASGSAVVIPAGLRILMCDGANNLVVF